MALIKCPECGKEISDKATSCPNCGFPLLIPQQPVQPQPVRQQPIQPQPACQQPIQPQVQVSFQSSASNSGQNFVICKPSIDAYIGSITLTLIGIFCFIKLWSLLGIFIIVVAAFMAMSISATNLTISPNGIQGEVGMGNRKSISAPLSTVSSVQVDDDIFGRSSGYGTITITCAEGVFVFKSMKNAEEFKQIFTRLRKNMDWH